MSWTILIDFWPFIYAKTKSNEEILKYKKNTHKCTKDVKRLLLSKVVDLPPPKFSEVNRTINCRQEMLNYYNCRKQNWTIVLDVAFRSSLSQFYVTPTTVQLKYAWNSPSSDNYVATLRYKIRLWFNIVNFILEAI